MTPATLRPARPDDAETICDLLDVASFGFVHHAFSTLVSDPSNTRAFLIERIMTSASALSLTKAEIAEIDGRTAGFLMTETIGDPANLVDADTPDILRPLLELESLAPGTRLVNFVACLPWARGQGLGTTLMTRAQEQPGPNGMSLTIHDRNVTARRLYERLGYVETSRRGIVKAGWDTPATEWILMVRP